MPDGGVPKPVLKAKVIRDGDHLGIELSKDLADQLGIKEGDFVEVEPANGGQPLTVRKVGADELFERVRAMRGLVPKAYRFKRDDAYDAR